MSEQLSAGAQLSAGDHAPEFTLESNQGQKSLRDFHGNWTVLYFYPKDNTPGCTVEACDFRDAMPGMGADVVGVSADDLASHADFAADHSLPFPLLSDPGNDVAKAYGAYGERYSASAGKNVEGVLRSTFIIDPEGKIADAMYNVNHDGHADEIGKKLKALQSA